MLIIEVSKLKQAIEMSAVMTLAILSLKSELLSQYRMPNALNIDVMSSNDTLDSILFHRNLSDFGTSNSGIPHTVDGPPSMPISPF